MKNNSESVNEMAFFRCSGVPYTIQQGDTLYDISRRYNIPLAMILRSNPYVDVYNLQVGDEICIPRWLSDDAPVTPGEGPMPYPTPSLPGNENSQPVTPGEGPMPFPTPSLPGNENSQPAAPGEGPVPLPTPSVPENGNWPFQGVYVYIIKDTDTLQDILDRFGLSLEDLTQFNNLNGMLLKPGTSINIPKRDNDM